MCSSFHFDFVKFASIVLALSLASPASAQDDGSGGGGMVKTIIGWLITLVVIGAGIAVVVRPSSRKEPKPKK